MNFKTVFPLHYQIGIPLFLLISDGMKRTRLPPLLNVHYRVHIPSLPQGLFLFVHNHIPNALIDTGASHSFIDIEIAKL